MNSNPLLPVCSSVLLALSLPFPSDVDECLEGVCAEECVNTPGSFRCFCDGRQGKKLGKDLRSCQVRISNTQLTHSMTLPETSISEEFLLRPSTEARSHRAVTSLSLCGIPPRGSRRFYVIETRHILSPVHPYPLLSPSPPCPPPQAIAPCMSQMMSRNPRSLYLGRMFSGVPVVRLRFRRRVPTG